jgi:L,D-transpeptidase YcbB
MAHAFAIGSFLQCLLMTATLLLGSPVAAQPLPWFEAGRAPADARQAVDVLAAAADQGLDPRDYDAAALAQALDRATNDPAEQIRVGAALTAALQRYVMDLQSGRIDPRRVHAKFDVPSRPPTDTAAFLRDALAQHRVAPALREAEPRLPMYAGLRQALARYRALAGHAAWNESLPPLPGRKLSPGQAYAGTRVMAQRLQALGDLPAGAAVPERFDGALVAALQAFQQRHGLTPDGVLGASTFAQLEVAPAARVRQIELAMERLRWTPFMQAPRMIAINVPEFVLRAYEVQDGQVMVRLTTRVVVGKAMGMRTPLMQEDLRFIEFSPFWNVPPSIARKETVPKLRREPAYLEREGLELVTPAGQGVTSVSDEQLDAVLRGGWRIRQRPGTRNALGGIKFVFPNDDNVYLHDTPSTQLFERDRRDFSHGCIRVQSPVALAQFVLRDAPAWTEERIREAMATGVSSTLRLKEAIPVLIAYSTVIVRGGSVYFYPDVYGEDAKLDRALRGR